MDVFQYLEIKDHNIYLKLHKINLVELNTYIFIIYIIL